jgi:hypothetical protein
MGLFLVGIDVTVQIPHEDLANNFPSFDLTIRSST